MKTIKIGRNEYKIKDGDYILYNGACYQFCSGDGRILKREGFDAYRFLRIPQTLVNKLKINTLKKEGTEKYIKYYL